MLRRRLAPPRNDDNFVTLSRKKYLLLAGGILAVGTISGLLILRGPSFVWQITKVFSATDQEKKLEKIQENLTSGLAQNLAGQIIKDPQFLEKKEGWAALDEATKNMAPEETFPLPEVPDSEIIILQDNSPEATQAYAKRIYEILQKHSQTAQEKIGRADIEIMEQAIDSNDFKDLAKLLELNQEIIQDLKKIPVPATWQTIHKEQIGLFLLYENILKAVQNTEEDPLKTLIALERFGQLPDLMETFTNKVADLLEKQT